ncbi:MAG: hypothetical protein ACR2PO_20160 [Methyloligellaceae bacterium]
MKIIGTFASVLFAVASFWLVSVVAAPVKVEPWNKGFATADVVTGWPLTR